MVWDYDNELELIEKAKKDIRFFEVLYRKYFPMINNFVYRRIYDEDLKNEIVANIFFKVMKKLKTFKVLKNKRTSFSAWLYRIAINEINQHYREEKRITKIYEAQKEDFIYNMQEKEPLLDVTFEDVKEKMKYLKPKERNIIALRFFEKLSYEQIAQILQINEGAAKVRVHRALKKLKNLFEKE
jgi:RNA polymerase sigma-70 factor (ECF subfamily)